MILILESDKSLSKKLCDLLNRERIICVDSGQQIVEMVCKYKNDINVIIANNHLLYDIMVHQVILKLCQKLVIEPSPIICYYKKDDQDIHKEFIKDLGQNKLIECDEKNVDFPERFIQIVKEAYPALNADIKKANEMWVKKPEDFVDIGKWLEEEGFLKTGKTAQPTESYSLIKPQPRKLNSKKDDLDYEKMYNELKKKYDELLKEVKDLIDSTGNSKEKH